MSERMRRTTDVPVELKHRIQLLLPVEEAARTCVLSKSWSHAWSTIPALSFPIKQQQFKYNNLIDATMLRKWIRYVPSCLKQLSLCIWVEIDSFTLPNEIFSIQNLNTIYVRAPQLNHTIDNSLWICSRTNNPMIKCLSLRVLDLEYVNITQNLLDNLFTTCTLLENINLCCCEGFNTIKVKNLLRLQVFKIVSLQEQDDILEIDNLPSLTVFHYNSLLTVKNKPIPFKMESLGCNLTQLSISGVILDNAFFNIIKSQFPLLHSLTLGIGLGGMETFVLTSESLNNLDIRLLLSMSFVMQVYAPKLHYCLFHGGVRNNINVHSLSFPSTPPDQLQLTMQNVNI